MYWPDILKDMINLKLQLYFNVSKYLFNFNDKYTRKTSTSDRYMLSEKKSLCCWATIMFYGWDFSMVE